MRLRKNLLPGNAVHLIDSHVTRCDVLLNSSDLAEEERRVREWIIKDKVFSIRVDSIVQRSDHVSILVKTLNQYPVFMVTVIGQVNPDELRISCGRDVPEGWNVSPVVTLQNTTRGRATACALGLKANSSFQELVELVLNPDRKPADIQIDEPGNLPGKRDVGVQRVDTEYNLLPCSVPPRLSTCNEKSIRCFITE